MSVWQVRNVCKIHNEPKAMCQVTHKAWKSCSFHDILQSTSVTEVTEVFSTLKTLLWRQNQTEEAGSFLPSPREAERQWHKIHAHCGELCTSLSGDTAHLFSSLVHYKGVAGKLSVQRWNVAFQVRVRRGTHRLKDQIGPCVVCEVRSGHNQKLQKQAGEPSFRSRHWSQTTWL